MKITIDGKEYRVWFDYPQRLERFKYKQRTICFIIPASADVEAPISEIEAVKYRGCVGRATKSHGDQFNKATGRKIALGRALQQLTADRAVRADAWRQYFEQTRHPEYKRERTGYSEKVTDLVAEGDRREDESL